MNALLYLCSRDSALCASQGDTLKEVLECSLGASALPG
jgi:hypothetical protein